MSSGKLIFFLLLLLHQGALGQNIAFHNLNTSNGLSDNNVTAVTTDHNGFLWIGTSDGLNLYDGRTLTRFYEKNTPGLAGDYVGGLLCDSQNRVWVGTTTGVTMIDERRRFNRIMLADSLEVYDGRLLTETRSYGVIILSNKGHFYFDRGKRTWEQLKFSSDIILKDLYTDGVPFNEDTLLFCGSRRSVFMIDYKSGKEIFRTYIPGVISACKITDSTIFAATARGAMFVVNTRTRKIENEFSTLKPVHGLQLSTGISKVRRAADGNIIITTWFGGIYIFNPVTQELKQYLHEPYDLFSLATNNTNKIHCEENGNVFITTQNAGVTFFNVKNYWANQVIAFKDGAGHVFDSYINQIAKDRNNNFWLAAYDRLIKWNQASNVSEFYFYTSPNENHGNRLVEINAVCVDDENNVWVGTNGGGIGLLDQQTKKFIIYDNGRVSDSVLRNNTINYFIKDNTGFIWAGTYDGVYRIDPHTKKIDPLTDHPVLKQLIGKTIYIIYIDKNNNFWFGTATNGAYCWNPTTGTMKNFTTKNNLLSNHCYAFAEGGAGSMYIGSPEGMSVLHKSGTIKNYNRSNGLRLNRCEGLLEDKKGNIWIGNDACIICFDPVTGTFRYFDEKTGLSHYGYRALSYLKDTNGVLYWGGEKGLSSFEPVKLLQVSTNPNPIVFKLSVGDSIHYTTGKDVYELPLKTGAITFHFAAVNVFGSRNFLYRYMLENSDDDWTTVMDQNEIRYSALKPGNYTFLLKGSADGINWIESRYPVQVKIIAPWWMRWWFKALAIMAVGAGIWLYIKRRERIIGIRESEKTELEKVKALNYRHQLEIEQVINFFASSLNDQNTVDGILWDVARNCISRLGFEDCVIYLKDETRNVLVQKAAWGPKTTNENRILNPLEIPVGHGIVGSVAASGKAEIIPDTSSDARYIMDDHRRYSEIAAPIIEGNRIIGVIDSEHSEKNFYTRQHLQILTTIAALCADKIDKITAEQQTREKEVEVLKLNQELATSKLTALRSQMNPHFIFNALNSMQQYILTGNVDEASRYFSKFSRLQREVLQYSDYNFIPLEKEIEILSLYLQLEQLRLAENFSYQININDDIDPAEVCIPPMILQPFVENAIWHGLMSKEGERKVLIRFTMQEDDLLLCRIEDNGIGRAASARLKKENEQHKSKGLSLVFQRLQLLQQQFKRPFEVTITDLVKSKDGETGTVVQLLLFTGN